jgi:hypothetical protein
MNVMLCDIDEPALAEAVAGLRRTTADVGSARADVSFKAELQAGAMRQSDASARCMCW